MLSAAGLGVQGPEQGQGQDLVPGGLACRGCLLVLSLVSLCGCHWGEGDTQGLRQSASC